MENALKKYAPSWFEMGLISAEMFFEIMGVESTEEPPEEAEVRIGRVPKFERDPLVWEEEIDE